MFINGDGDWVYLLNNVLTYDSIHSTTKMTSVDSSNNPQKVKYRINEDLCEHKLKAGDYVRNAD